MTQIQKKKKPISRALSVMVKTARRRKASSTRWLQRQLNDPYVLESKRLGYRSRAAFKLLEINEKFNIIKKNHRVLDLGAAPGGWTQVAAEKVTSRGFVLGLDILEMDTISGAELYQRDIFAEDTLDFIQEKLCGKADVVLSDMSPSTTGHRSTDHVRIIMLVEAALDVAIPVLKPGGTFVAKVFQGGADHDLLKLVKERFASVKHYKPESSRKDSPETYLIAQKFLG